MKDLRLIGVHEDGEHVLLSDAEGTRYRVPLDEALRAAARRDRPRLGQLQIEIDGGLRPRDVQALIRAGLSTEEVADRAGWTVEKVQRFEGPVLAEREYIANQARAVVVGTGRPNARQGGSAPAEQTLGSRADERFKTRGVQAELVRWDSQRLDDGRWTVMASFPAGGRERVASWTFDPRLKSLLSGNDEARWLSEDGSSDSAIPTPHVASGSRPSSAVFDVEASGGVEEESRRGRAEAEADEPIDLMAAMRDQSSRRRGNRRRSSPTHTPAEDAGRDDALPLEDLVSDPAEAPEPPAAHGDHPEEAHLDERDEAPEVEDAGDDAGATDADGPDREPTPSKAKRRKNAGKRPTPPVEKASETGESAPKPPARGGSRKSGRPAVPSWDDIMFGGGRGGN